MLKLSNINKKTLFSITIITLISLLLRLYNLSGLPYNLYEDEVLSGYIGRFILQNGKDIYGNSWPLFYFNKFGDYYIIGPIYLSGLSTFIFGITPFAVRFPAAFLGGLLTIPIYLLSKSLFKNEKLALLSSLFYAISPWSIVMSRTTTEGVIGSFFFTFGVYFFVKSLKESSLLELFFANIFFLIGYFIYHPFRIYPPAILILSLILSFIFKLKLKKRYKIFLIASFLLFSLFTISIGQTKWGRGRFLQTSIFAKVSGVQLRIQDLIFTEKTKNTYIIRLFHNKLWHYGREFIKQYTTYLSPNFLTINGWEKSRYFVIEQGLIYFSFAVLFYLGIIYLLNKLNFEKSFALALLFLAPLPAAFTYVESPNPHRSFFLLIPISLLAPIGLIFIENFSFPNRKFTKIFKSLFPKAILLMVAFEFVYFIHQYSTHYDIFSAFYRNDGQKEAAYLLQDLQKRYDKVYISDTKTMSWYYLFYSKNFDRNLIGRFGLDAKIKNIGNIYFVKKDCPSEMKNLPERDPKDKIVVIDRPECKSNFKDYALIKTFKGKHLLLKYKVLVPKFQK